MPSLPTWWVFAAYDKTSCDLLHGAVHVYVHVYRAGHASLALIGRKMFSCERFTSAAYSELAVHR